MERIERRSTVEITKAPDSVPDVAIERAFSLAECEIAPIEEVIQTPEAITILKACREADQAYMRDFLGLDVSIEGDREPDIRFAKNGLILYTDRRGVMSERKYQAITSVGGKIVIDHRVMDNPGMLAHDVLHELFHFFHARKQRYVVSPQELINGRRKEYLEKHGYMSTRGNDLTQMTGFNEAVTERMAREAYSGYLTAISDQDKKGVLEKIDPIVYKRERVVLDHIIQNISHMLYPKDANAKIEIWKKIARGPITGKNAHLREIEKVYGKDSLRLLASMVPQKIKVASAQKLDSLLLQDDYVTFFNPSTKEEERERLRAKIFSDQLKSLGMAPE